MDSYYTAMHKQTAVTAYLKMKQLLLFAFQQCAHVYDH